MGVSRCIGRVGALAVALGVGTAVTFPHTALADEGAGSNGSVSVSSRESTSGATGTSDRESSSSPSKPAATRPSDSDDTETSGPDGDEPNADGSEPTEEDTEPSSTPATSPEPPADPDPAESLAPSTLHPESGSTPEPVHSITATTVADLPTSAPPEEPASQPPRTDVPAAYPRTSPAIQAPASSVGALSTPVSQPVSLVGALVSTVLAPFSGGAPAAPSQPPLLWVVLAWVRRELQRTFANSTPTTTPQSVTLTLDSATSVSGPIEFDADDVDDDPLVYTVPGRGAVGGPTHGTVTVDQTTGTFTYNPDDAYALIGGTDTFTYTVSDAGARRTFFGIPLSRSATTATGIVTVTLNPVHVAPVTNGDTATTVEDRPVTIAVLDNDTDANGDALTVSGVTQGTSGTVTFTASGVTYTPNADFTGTDTFTYTATDGRSAGTATVTVTVTPVDDAPVAVGDSVTVAEDSGPNVIDVLANDTDIDAGPKTITAVTRPAKGSIVVTGTTVTYTPTADFHGTDTFTYTLNGGATATVTVTVTPVDDAPVAVGDSVTVAEDSGPTTIDVLANDTDIDAGPKTITAVTQPVDGTVTFTPTGVTYTPDADFHGTDTFTYTLNGGATATVTVTVNAAPVIGQVTTTPGEGNTWVVSVSADDAENDTLTTTVASADPTIPLTVTKQTDGTFQVVADPTWASAHPAAQIAVTVTVTDTYGSSATTTSAIGTANNVISLGWDAAGVGHVPALPAGVSYTQVAGGAFHTVLLRSDGSVVGAGQNNYGQLDIPPLPAGVTYTQVAAGSWHTVLLRSDGTVVAVGDNFKGQIDIPEPGLGVSYTGVAAGELGTILLRSDGTAVAVGDGQYGQLEIPTLPTGVRYAQAAIGSVRSVLLRSDGTVVTVGMNDAVPTLPAGVTYIAVASGAGHAVLLRSDGVAVAFGANDWGQTDIPALPAGVVYVNIAASRYHSVLLRSDGTAVAVGQNTSEQLDIPVLPAGVTYTGVAAGGYSTWLISSTAAVPFNTPPVAANDTVTVAEGGTATISVTANDTDADGTVDTATVVITRQPTAGSVAVNAAGTVTYVSNGTEVTADSFAYRINDALGATSNEATVFITITPVDDAPVAVNDAVTVAEDSGTTVIDVLANDTDIDGGPKTITAITQPTSGTTTITATGVAYTPNENFHGTDTFTYTLNGGTTAEVTVTVTPVDDAPVAPDLVVTISEDTRSVAIHLTDGATDVDGDALWRGYVTYPAIGDTFVDSDNLGIQRLLRYYPPANYTGQITIPYTVWDGQVFSNWATITINVTPVNDAPVAVNDSAAVEAGGTTTITLTANDTDVDSDNGVDPATIVIGTQPSAGTVTVNSDGTVTYTSTGTTTTTDIFTYTVEDTTGLVSNPATVTVNVTATATPPVAVNDSVTVDEGGTTTLAVIANDTDADGDIDTATVVIVRQPTAGTATVNSDGTVSYASDGSEITTDSFEYTVRDVAGAVSNAATVIITVTSGGDAPVAVNDTVTITEDTLATFIDVLANDTDIDGGPKTITSITSPAGGHALVIGNRVRYFSAPNFHGTETFTYTLNGGATATVTVIVTPISEAPVIHRVTSTPGVGNTWVLSVDASDDDGGALTTTVTSANATVPLTITRLPGGAIQVDIDPTWARAHPGAQLPVTVTVTDAENISATKQLTIGTVSNAVFFGHNIYGQRNIPALPEGVTYTQVATASLSHTVLLRSDGTAVAVGDNFRGQLNIPPLPTGMTYTQVANGTEHTVLLRSDGTAIAVGNNSDGQLNIPRLPAGVTYTRIAAGNYGTVLLRSDGTAVGAGYNTYGQLNIPQPPPGVTYTQAAVGLTHTVLLRSDGTAVALGDNAFGQTVIPALPTGLKYTQVAAGDLHSVLLRSDGSVVAFGNNQWGQSTVPALPAGLRYTQVAAGRYNSMLLRSDGTAIGFGQNASSQLNIPVLPAGLVYTQAAASNHTVLLFSTSSSFNSLPLATNDAATVAEGGTITFSVTANDTDTDGTLNTATVVITRQPTSGSVTVNAGGTVTYVSNGAEVSADSFAYRVNDNKGATSNEATVSITITPVNDAPVAVDDAYTVAKNGVLVISAPGLLANDSDSEGNSFTIVSATGTQHGTVDPLYSNGSFTYRPAAGYSGTDTFTYTISDGTSMAQATVTITVSAVDNQVPVAVADSYTVAEDGVLNVTGPGVLANDTDADGDPLSVVAAGPTSHGTFTLRSDGSFTYTPVANFHGTDSFTYQVSDGSGPSAPATVTITVTPVNDAPVVQNDTIPFPKDGFIGFSLTNRSSDVDGDTLTATLISGTTHGTLFFDGTNRAFSYRPNTGFTGQDSFTYKVNDGKVDSAIATVTLNVS